MKSNTQISSTTYSDNTSELSNTGALCIGNKQKTKTGSLDRRLTADMKNDEEKHIIISGVTNLITTSKLPECVEILDIENCPDLYTVNLKNSNGLTRLNIANCPNIDNIVLPESLDNLKFLTITNCNKIEKAAEGSLLSTILEKLRNNGCQVNIVEQETMAKSEIPNTTTTISSSSYSYSSSKLIKKEQDANHL